MNCNCDNDLNYSIKDYLQDRFPTLSESTLRAICMNGGYNDTTYFFDLDEKQKDLLMAECYRSLIMSGLQGKSRSTTDGNYSTSESTNVPRYLIGEWRHLYISLRRKWGMDSELRSSIRLINL